MDLKKYGIACFVAHKDIEPTKEWQNEIETALFSMDALAAILAKGFGRSNWTDHEVGFALGREKLVLPIMYGRNPYGLLSKYQGLRAEGKSLNEVSQIVFQALIKNRMTASNCSGNLFLAWQYPPVFDEQGLSPRDTR